MNNRVVGLLGMARRAGRLTVGFDAVKASVSAHRARTVLLAADVSPKTEKEIRFVAADTVSVQQIDLTKEEIGHAIGSEKPAGVIATEDRGFAEAFQKATECRNEEDAV